MPRIAGRYRALSVAVLVAVWTGCRDGRIPLPEFPQVTQARELGEFGGERIRDSNACRAETTTVEALVTCMERRGWVFVRRWGVFPSPSCWEAREASDARSLPEPMCFQRAAAPPPGAAPPPAATPTSGQTP